MALSWWPLLPSALFPHAGVPQGQPVNVSLTGIMAATTDPVFLGANATARNTNQTVGVRDGVRLKREETV